MSKEMIKEKLIQYKTNQDIKAIDYFSSLFKNPIAAKDLVDALKELFKDADIEHYSIAISFFLLLLKYPKKMTGLKELTIVDEIKDDDEIFEILKNQLYASKINRRQITIDILVELKYQISLDYLNEAYNVYIKSDPLSLPYAIYGLIRLHNYDEDFPWELIDNLVHSDLYLVRWSFLVLLELTNLEHDVVLKYLEILKNDKEEVIRLEAEYYFNKIQCELDEGYEDYIIDNNHHHCGEHCQEGDHEHQEDYLETNEDKPKITYSEMVYLYMEELDHKIDHVYSFASLEQFALDYIRLHQ